MQENKITKSTHRRHDDDHEEQLHDGAHVDAPQVDLDLEPAPAPCLRTPRRRLLLLVALQLCHHVGQVSRKLAALVGSTQRLHHLGGQRTWQGSAGSNGWQQWGSACIEGYSSASFLHDAFPLAPRGLTCMQSTCPMLNANTSG